MHRFAKTSSFCQSDLWLKKLVDLLILVKAILSLTGRFRMARLSEGHPSVRQPFCFLTALCADAGATAKFGTHNYRPG